jgi:RNA polymerase sigma-70 factor (ECF subfamily)
MPPHHALPPLADAVVAARAGDVAAFRVLVEATREMAYAVAWQMLRRDDAARDVVQEAYLAAFRRLGELTKPDAFAGWLRRIVVTTALNHRRRGRTTWLPLDDAATPPVLDAEERTWTLEQQRTLARAVLLLSHDERRLCERYYHGGWTAERLAHDAGVDARAMRKRLQRIRDKLRTEIEMDEQRNLSAHGAPLDLPASIVELLARPRLVDLPENPVGACLAELAAAFPGFAPVDLPEEIDLDAAARKLGGDAVYIERSALHRIEGERVLRYDLTLPLLLEVRCEGAPLKLRAAGKVYRRERESATHLEAFHQLELFTADARGAIDCFTMAGRILDAVDRVLPRSEFRVTPTEYPMCARAFSLDVRRDEAWIELMAWGEYAPWVLRAIGADAERDVAIGAGFGLERIATLRYGIDDIRKVASTSVA